MIYTYTHHAGHGDVFNPWWGGVGVGLLIILSSFACQLLGHRLHEDLAAPPRLFHGLVAAWPLELTAVWLRLGVSVAKAVDCSQLWGHVDAIRAHALSEIASTESEFDRARGTQYREL